MTAQGFSHAEGWARPRRTVMLPRDDGRPRAATPQTLPRDPLDRRGGIKEALGLSGDEDGAGEGPWQWVRGRVGLGGMVSW